MKSKSSRLPGLFRLDVAARRALVEETAGLAPGTLAADLEAGGLDLATADQMIENVVGTYALPFGIAPNFVVNGQELLVPMVVEEPSVVAAAANAAKMTRAGGGFQATVDPPLMTAQIQLVDVVDPDDAARRLEAAAPSILAEAAELSPRLCARGGGPRSLSARVLSRPGDLDGGMLVVHLDVDCRDAMGANLVNTLAETLAPRLAERAGGRPALRILTNLSDQRLVRVTTRVPRASLGDDDPALIVQASRFAELDAYRAATHNKGILNGVDAVLVATGNDWRGVEAGAHAFAASGGRYRPLAVWRLEGDELHGTLAMPMAVGTVGGALRCHAGARLALAILGISTAAELAGVIGAAGLATNLAALRALAHEGIQEGHMALHRRAHGNRLEPNP